MSKSPDCENGCLVAEARGVQYACQNGNCAYAHLGKACIRVDADADYDDPMEIGDATWCHDPDMGAR